MFPTCLRHVGMLDIDVRANAPYLFVLFVYSTKISGLSISLEVNRLSLFVGSY